MSKQKTLSIEKQEVALCRNIWQNSSQNDCIAITDDAGEVIEVVTTPRVNPGMFRRRVRDYRGKRLKNTWLRHRRNWSFSMT